MKLGNRLTADFEAQKTSRSAISDNPHLETGPVTKLWRPGQISLSGWWRENIGILWLQLHWTWCDYKLRAEPWKGFQGEKLVLRSRDDPKVEHKENSTASAIRKKLRYKFYSFQLSSYWVLVGYRQVEPPVTIYDSFKLPFTKLINYSNALFPLQILDFATNAEFIAVALTTALEDPGITISTQLS